MSFVSHNWILYVPLWHPLNTWVRYSAGCGHSVKFRLTSRTKSDIAHTVHFKNHMNLKFSSKRSLANPCTVGAWGEIHRTRPEMFEIRWEGDNGCEGEGDAGRWRSADFERSKSRGGETPTRCLLRPVYNTSQWTVINVLTLWQSMVHIGIQ